MPGSAAPTAWMSGANRPTGCQVPGRMRLSRCGSLHQHGLAGGRARRAHRPVVGTQALVIQVLGGHPKLLPVDTEAVPFIACQGAVDKGKALRHIGVQRQREDLLRLLQSQLVDELLRHHFGLEVGGMGVVHEMDQGHQVGHAPGARHQTGCLEFDRVLHGVLGNVGVDTVDVVLEELARGGVQLQGVAIAIAPQAQHTHADVAGQRVGAEGGRQFAAPGGAEQLHLHQPVSAR